MHPYSYVKRMTSIKTYMYDVNFKSTQYVLRTSRLVGLFNTSTVSITKKRINSVTFQYCCTTSGKYYYKLLSLNDCHMKVATPRNFECVAFAVMRPDVEEVALAWLNRSTQPVLRVQLQPIYLAGAYSEVA